MTASERDPIAVVDGANKRYGGVQALADVSFSLAAGEVRALLGKNGAGKSTLIRMLAGAEAADSGTVTLSGAQMGKPSVQRAHELGVRTVYQELSVIPGLSIAENCCIGEWPTKHGSIDRRAMHDNADRALARIGVHLDPRHLVGDLSIADQQLVEIARALDSDPALLILDEPTSSLAAAEVDRVMDAVRAIRARGVAVIYVSHRLPEVFKIADTATVMRDGRVIDTVDLSSVNTEQLVAMMLGDVGAVEPLVQTAATDGTVVAEIRQIALSPKLIDVSFNVRAGEVLGIAGVLGSGRTELLQIISGLRAPGSGTVTVNGRRIQGKGLRAGLRAGIGLTPEDRKNDGIVPDLGIDENTVVTNWSTVSSHGLVQRTKVAAAARKVIDALSVKAPKTTTPIGTLSGGNQQKVVIGRWLHAGSTLLLLDEPTRGVDVQAKAQIYALLRALAESGKAVVFVSSEMDELNLVCDRVVVLTAGRIVTQQVAPNIETDQLLVAAIAERIEESA